VASVNYNTRMNNTQRFPDAIDRVRLATLLAPAARGWPVEIVDETGSTNADLIAHLKTLPHQASALAQPVVRVALRQTAGHGRRGRAWYAAPGDALLFSLACIVPRAPDALTGLGLAVSVTLVDALRSLPVASPGQIALKWPNDVLLEGNKLAGVLIESAWMTPDASAIVTGIGINVRGTDELATRLDTIRAQTPATVPGTMPATLSQAWPAANLTDTLAAALNALEPALQRFSAEGFAPFQARWNGYHAYAGREVSLFEQGVEIHRGIAAGVDERGQLLLDTPHGRKLITTGDVSLRLANPR
jgi:BirA family biotin operon repressor/biotin-[acetyl-CoA-carboxylase] ligase